MATIITSECINCGACEPECPNTAIYAGGAPWELNGESHPAIAEDIYYIVPSKCSECVGFFDHEACAAVSPVDCCVPDPNNPESHEALLARARELHPELTIPDDAPSRFRKGQAAAAPKAEAAAVAASDGAPGGFTSNAAETTAPAPAPKPAAPPPPQPATKPAAAAPKPTPVAPPPPPAPSAAPSSLAQDASELEFDPTTWVVPVICKNCNEQFEIAYRHFQVGVVFYCPHCSGSFVPTSTLFRTVRDMFEGFYGRRRKEREAFEQRRARELEQFRAKQAAEMEEFKEKLAENARTMRPAGKFVQPKGIAAMFT